MKKKCVLQLHSPSIIILTLLWSVTSKMTFSFDSKSPGAEKYFVEGPLGRYMGIF